MVRVSSPRMRSSSLRSTYRAFCPWSKRLELLLDILRLTAYLENPPTGYSSTTPGCICGRAACLNCGCSFFGATKPVEKFARHNKWKRVPKIF
eukprot:jgi/Bigna1/61323/fgenesh1_kg.20_\